MRTAVALPSAARYNEAALAGENHEMRTHSTSLSAACSPRGRYLPSNHPSSITNSKAFTLIELLVVIAILALLMSILMPMLQRARKHAKAVACQGNLRQWSILYATYAAENDGRLPSWRGGPTDPGGPWWGWWGWGTTRERRESPWYAATKDIMLCPMAAKPANPTDEGSPVGGTFLAWGFGAGPESWWYGHGSYGVNEWTSWWYWGDEDTLYHKLSWLTTDVKDAETVPVLLDSAWCWGGWYGANGSSVPPPEFDAVPTMTHTPFDNPFCINRHDGYVNGVFLDWSVRKVGLKELWAIRWHKDYVTRGPWTIAGGAKPEDWPQWMRRFRDY